MGAEVVVEGLTKSFGSQAIWRDVTLTLPPGEVSAMLGPSGTGKSVFLKSMIGLLKPEEGKCVINGVDIVRCSERELYETRKLFGVLFQDGALFGSMNLYDNVAFPLREHTKKSESEIKRIVLEKLEMTGLSGAEGKLPGEISGGMRKRAGLARALVLDPEIILCDEPDSGLDPVRTAYLSQLLIDLNTQIDATILVVTHNINLARTLPDNQKDTAQMAAEQAMADAGHHHGGTEDVRGIVPQILPTPGLPDRKGERRRKDRVMQILHTLPPAAQEGIIESLSPEEQRHYGVQPHHLVGAASGAPAGMPHRDGFEQREPS